MNRIYKKWYSPALQKEMELLVFGHGGASILFFPARLGRFYDYENWRLMEAIRSKLENGHLTVFCVDSVDIESFYNKGIPPEARLKRHIQYEHYIIDEVIPFMQQHNHGAYPMVAGCSLGAYHAMNVALRHPGMFNKVIAMSGRYDLTQMIAYYEDLLGGYWSEDVYFQMPAQYLPGITDENTLSLLRNMDVVMAIGKADVLLESNLWLEKKLREKGINCFLHIWDDEAHRARYWRKMVAAYL